MPPQIISVGKSSATGRANIWFLRFVDVLVLLEIVLGGEGMLASGASKRSLSRVRSLVTFQLHGLGERLFAIVAFVRLLATVRRPHVVREMGARLKNSVTFFARMARRLVCAGNVIANVQAVLELPIANEAEVLRRVQLGLLDNMGIILVSNGVSFPFCSFSWARRFLRSF